MVRYNKEITIWGNLDEVEFQFQETGVCSPQLVFFAKMLILEIFSLLLAFLWLLSGNHCYQTNLPRPEQPDLKSLL